MKSVYKYPVSSDDYFQLDMPYGAEILSVQVQQGNPYIWALVDKKEDLMVTRKFRLARTGHPISETNLSFIGTFQLDDGYLVFHLFEIGE